MNTSHKGRKALFVAIFLVVATFGGGQFARAQVIETPATTAQIDALKETLISLLTQMIAQLQVQLTEIIAQQSATQTQVTAIVQNAMPAASSTPTFGAASLSAYSYTPVVTFGGSSQATTNRAYFIMPSDMEEGYISLYDNGARTKLKPGRNDFSGFNQYQNQPVMDRINNVSPTPQTYTWTISARSADTSFSTTTGSFLGSQAWVIN